MGRILIIGGLAIAALGVVVSLSERLPIKLGRLPGDIRLEGKSGSFYFPIVTCLLVSAIASFIMWLIGKR